MPTVLLVEDDVNNTSLLEDAFCYGDIPARLVTVASGEEALDLAVSLRPALILMDLRLPGIDGLETTEILNRNPLTRDIPVWAISAYAMPGDAERARAAGCCNYFAKPLSMRDFGHCLKNFLRELTETESRKYASAESVDR
jgi:two-component system, cell cycle response regulator DivK